MHVFRCFRFNLFMVVGLVMGSGLAVSSTASAIELQFAFQKEDRVLFLGNTMIERAQAYGYLETALATVHSKLNLRFRNLGWSGDTVWADSRGIFEAPEKGYAKMLEQVKTIQPTVIFLGYGANESFAGQAGLEKFAARYRKLIADLNTVANKPRFVFLSPLPQPQFGKPFPDTTKQNKNITLYADAVAKIAKENESVYFDLLTRFSQSEIQNTKPGNYYERSMNLTPKGYLVWTEEILAQLGIKRNGLVKGFPKEHEKLRKQIVEKNELYFHHWRPQNITYLLLFRKHEQGNNAVDLTELLKLVDAADQAIHKLAQKKS